MSRSSALMAERFTHVATRVHHTKCIITHIQAYIYIYIYIYIHHAQCYHIVRESKTDIANVLKVWPSKAKGM